MGKFFEYPTPSGIAAGDEKIVMEKSGITYSPSITYIALSVLGDVDITTRGDGQGLVWNSTTEKWETTDFTISLLEDTTITTPQEDDYLKYSGGLWINSAFPTLTTTLEDLTDTNFTPGVGIDGYSLTWDNGTSRWIASSITLDGLPDTNFTAGAGIDGYVLTYDDGTSMWIAQATATSLEALSDTNVSGIGVGEDGYALTWDNGTTMWVASAIATSLEALSDTNVSGIGVGEDGYALVWDNDTTMWIASPVSVDLTAVASNIVSATTNTYDLGSLTFEWKDLHLAGAVYKSGLELTPVVASATEPADTSVFWIDTSA